MTKSLPKILVLLVLFSLIASCKGEGGVENCTGCGENLIYGDQKSGGAVEEIVPIEVMDTAVTMDEEFVENKEKIIEKFGEQWDFCHCILANDSLDKVVKSGAEIGDDFMARFEVVDQKCKAFLVMSPNQTPEERAAHERKAKQCLRNR